MQTSVPELKVEAEGDEPGLHETALKHTYAHKLEHAQTDRCTHTHTHSSIKKKIYLPLQGEIENLNYQNYVAPK